LAEFASTSMVSNAVVYARISLPGVLLSDDRTFVAAGDARPVGARACRQGATASAGAGGGHLDGRVGRQA